ncbi:hypothetical protein TPHA_0B00990 [Tetrapisispora phaffii CBS 4417]|uniref:Septin-type G domain-containing protein n=1 Tax=Tetrapisispora phaffii (strain ATCC 24235 / CBS 4417 / NBRC 1672 / NRRL Y-8282 / UCD 70-5) TaxID=1071381 RepID=G8BQH4_TETPH|nr:hypothetical protein TPHA_0B00990 [Tetrapisispora phaffii CBS 4417]CCE61771.1 hypothetical protein TPHA_0B00990 [Tetrapisispora phaffii CBS 4417]
MFYSKINCEVIKTKEDKNMEKETLISQGQYATHSTPIQVVSNGVTDVNDSVLLESNQEAFKNINNFEASENEDNIGDDNNKNDDNDYNKYCHNSGGSAEINNILESYQQLSIFEKEKVSNSSVSKTMSESTNFKEDYHVGIDLIIKQKERIIKDKGINFTVMVAGQYGLGKSTFINTLFGENLLSVSDYRTHTMEVDITMPPTKLITIHKANLVGNNCKVNLTVIDTPGFGSKMNSAFSWTPLTNHIDEKIRTNIFQEEQPDRTMMNDGRVHCCIYFIEPINKGLTTLDVVTMKELSKRVNLIPVIAKADTLTKKELVDFKLDIRQILEIQNIEVCQFLDSNDSYYDDLIKNAPYSIISSDKRIKNERGEIVYGRNYGWGKVEVENPGHSDFALLRDLLFNKYLPDLIFNTEDYYETCRATLLKTRLLKCKEIVQTQSSELVGGVEISQELRDILSTFDYEDFDKNGLKNYICYQIFDKNFIDSIVLEWSQEYVHKQWETKKKFNDVVALEETKFQDWRKAILQKQEQFNNEINSMHSKIERLQIDCKNLETKGISGEVDNELYTTKLVQS